MNLDITWVATVQAVADLGVRVRFSPHFLVKFSADNVQELQVLSSGHYDYLCKRLSYVGGLIYGMRNHLTVGECEVELDTNELDILCKVLESHPDSELNVKMRTLLDAACKLQSNGPAILDKGFPNKV